MSALLIMEIANTAVLILLDLITVNAILDTSLKKISTNAKVCVFDLLKYL